MFARKGFTLIELMIVIIILGVLAIVSYPTYMRMEDRAREGRVTNDAHTVQLAVEDYSAQHEGEYSTNQADIQPLLAHGSLLVNVFTGAASEPQFGVGAATEGQIGLVPIVDHGTTVGYHINGWGKDSELLVLTSGQ